jgi:hypothetical protein
MTGPLKSILRLARDVSKIRWLMALVVAGSLIILAWVGYGLFRLISYSPIDCEALAASTPEPLPIYPGSELVGRDDICNDERCFWYLAYYQMTDTPEQVMSFFKSELTCGCAENYDYECWGDAEPVGGYSVTISREPGLTSYEISVIVDRCESLY